MLLQKRTRIELVRVILNNQRRLGRPLCSMHEVRELIFSLADLRIASQGRLLRRGASNRR
jgi:hypothetical protein